MGRSGGGRSGGFSGGGRSRGGFSSGGRSSGGFSGGFGSGRSGRSGGSSFGGGSSRSGGGPRSSPPMGGGWFYPSRRVYGGPIIINNSGNGNGGGGGYHGDGPHGGSSQGNSGCGRVFLTVFVVLLVVVLIAGVLIAIGGSSASVGASTVSREKLPASATQSTAFYEDTAGWISHRSELERGLKSFYKATGVHPYLYITEHLPAGETPQCLAESLYDQRISDEGHFLLVFYDNGQGGYDCGYVVGAEAKTVMDDEAVGILADYLNRYYTSDLSDEEFLSAVFEKTGERIMTVTKSPLPIVAVCVVVVVLAVLLFLWWKRSKEAQAAQAKRAQEILETPLEQFGDDTVENLAKKYEDDGEGESS